MVEQGNEIKVDETQLRFFYLVSALVWIFIIFFFKFVSKDNFTLLILLYPLIEFVIFSYIPPKNPKNIGTLLINTGAYTLFFLVKGYGPPPGNKKKIQKVQAFKNKHNNAVMLALILIMISSSNVWDNQGDSHIIMFVPSSLVTMSMALLAYAIVGGYINFS